MAARLAEFKQCSEERLNGMIVPQNFQRINFQQNKLWLCSALMQCNASRRTNLNKNYILYVTSYDRERGLPDYI